jgi:hypothetical protein
MLRNPRAKADSEAEAFVFDRPCNWRTTLMAQSLVSMVMQSFGPSTIDRLAGALGATQDSAQKGVSAAVPALLTGLVGMVARPGGADRLATAVQQQDPSILDNLSTMIGSGGHQALSENGGTLLTSLLGTQASDGLVGSIAKYAGLGLGSASGLMGLIVPVVMAVLRRQQTGVGLDAGGLGRMLAEQKETIAGSMPAGFSLPALGGIRGAAETLKQAVPTTPIATIQRSAIPAWAYALGGLVILALIGYWILGARGPQRVATQTPGVQGSLMVGQVDVAKQLSTIVDNTTKSLNGVTDAASAKTALPQLNEAISQLDGVKGLIGQMPAEGKKTLSSIAGDAKPRLLQLIDKVQAMPGVADVLRPTLDTFKARLDTFTTPV